MESPSGERFEIIPPDEVKPTSASAFMVTKAYDSIRSHDDSKSIIKDYVEKSKSKSEETPITRNKGFAPIALPEDVEMSENGIGEDDMGGPPAPQPDDDDV